MKSIIFAFTLLLIGPLAFGQKIPSFLLGDGIIYGIGISSEQEAADNYALLSLSKAIKVNVSSVSTYKVTSDTKKETAEEYKKETNVSSDILLPGSSVIVAYDGENYTVYRYIDKNRYVSACMAEYGKWMSIAEAYSNPDSTKVKHADNIILGACYMAYKSLDTDIMSAISFESSVYKERALNMAKTRYLRPYSGISRYTDTWHGIIICSTNYMCGWELPGVEILVEDNVWKEPNSITDLVTDNGNYVTRGESQYSRQCKGYYASVSIEKDRKNKKIPFRYTYEIVTDGILSKLNVEEEWYFAGVYHRAF